MFKLNNKGFAVSAVLYTILIAFLMFLGVTLAQFSSSITLINNANKDLVDGQVKLSATPITAYDTDENGNPSATPRTDIKVQIKSKYGTMYWPKDFKESGDATECIVVARKYKNIETTYDATNKKLIIRDDISCPYNSINQADNFESCVTNGTRIVYDFTCN